MGGGRHCNLTFDGSTLTLAGVADITDTTDATDATGDTGALRCEGGASIAKNVWVGKAVKPSYKTDTSVASSTVTFDLDESNTFAVTLAADRTFAIDNEDPGQKFILRVLQDGSGGHTITWFSTIKWAGGSAPTQIEAANKASVYGFICTGTDTYDGFVLGQNL